VSRNDQWMKGQTAGMNIDGVTLAFTGVQKK
jgi:hypothetical protein